LKLHQFILLLVFALQCENCHGQNLPAPEVSVSSIIFSDSTLVKASTTHEQGTIMVEISSGSATFYREYEGPFYVKKTKTLRFKLAHPDYYDSQITAIKVFKESALTADIAGASAFLQDQKRGSAELNENAWQKEQTEKTVLQFTTDNKKLEEVELLTYVKSEEGILPPKKVVLYAHLKNGKRVHIRTSNTIGKFKNQETYWSHVLRLNGKPKLKKILRKTVYFSIEITPYFNGDEPRWVFIDELLVRKTR